MDDLPRLTILTRRSAQACALVVMLIAAIVCLGWAENYLPLASFSEFYKPMPPGAALSFFVLSAALWLSTLQRPYRLARWAIIAGLGLIMLLALLVIVDFITGAQIGPDRIVLGPPFASAEMARRVSPVTTFVSFLYCIVLVMLNIRGQARLVVRWAIITALLGISTGSILLLWYLYGTPLLYDTSIIPAPIPSVLIVIALGAGQWFAVAPQSAGTRYLLGNSLQARLARVVIPIVITLILLKDLIQRTWLPTWGIGIASFTFILLLIFVPAITSVLWVLTRHVSRQTEQAQKALIISERRLRGIVEQSVDGIVMTDEVGNIAEWNASQESITGLKANTVLGHPIWEVQCKIGHPETQTPARLEAVRSTIQRALQTGDGAMISRQTEIPFQRADGERRIMQSNAFPISTDKGYILCGIARDITRRKQAEEALFWELAENAALSTLYKPLISANTSLAEIAHTILEQAQSLTGSAHGYVSVIDPLTKDNVGYTLTEMMDTCRIEGQDRRIVFSPAPDGSYPGLWGYTLNTRQPFYTNEPGQHPSVRGTPQGHVALEQFLSVPVLLGDELVGQIALANPGREYSEYDLEAAKRLGEYYALAIQRCRAEETIQREHANLLKIFHTVPVGMLLVNDETEIVEANAAAGEITFQDPALIIGKRSGAGLRCIHSFEDPRGCGFSHSCPSCPLRRGIESVLQSGASVHGEEICVTLLSGDQPQDRVLSVSAEPILINNRQHVIIVIDDITERKRNEEHVQVMLQEKEILLKEIHHRVKNNLQIVNSLLSLHAEAIQDPQDLQVFEDCQNNVRAIALIHESIYQNPDLAHIDVRDYLELLVNHLNLAFGQQSEGIHLQMDIEPTYLDPDTAIPCGLILTELFTNAVKHAFPPDWQPSATGKQIWISFQAQDERYTLAVRDNGIGLTPDFKLRQKSSSIGLQLVELLIQQMKGSIAFNAENGASFTITFPLRPG